MKKRAIALLGETADAHGWTLQLVASGFDVCAVRDSVQVLALLGERPIDAVVVRALDPSRDSALAFVPAWRRAQPGIRVVLVSPHRSEELVLAALRGGVSDYLREPVSGVDLLRSIEAVTASGESSATRLTRPDPPPRSSGAIVGSSRAIQQVRDYIDRVARTDTTVLITGETGVGKELVAGMIHAGSPRARRPCVSINCAAIPDTLLESELFGVERGAYTGADRHRDGTLKSADGGSVFFDEIGDMGLLAQAKILRAIEVRAVNPLGGSSRVPLDVRIIAATNQELEALVHEARFRKDLYYRLNVARIHVPPLRDRPEDLEPLLAFYITQLNRRFNRQVRGLTPGAIEQLRRHDWPGNVRELRNLLEATFVGLDGRRVDFADLPEAFQARLARPDDVSETERKRLLDVLFATNWNKSKAAQELNWSRMTLYRKLAKYHVVRDQPSLRKPA